jgi:uncharacterized protein Usg
METCIRIPYRLFPANEERLRVHVWEMYEIAISFRKMDSNDPDNYTLEIWYNTHRDKLAQFRLREKLAHFIEGMIFGMELENVQASPVQ